MTGKEESRLGNTLAEIVIKTQHDGMVLWEQKLRMHLRPKPRWWPAWFYVWVLQKLLVQSQQMREVCYPSDYKGGNDDTSQKPGES